MRLLFSIVPVTVTVSVLILLLCVFLCVFLCFCIFRQVCQAMSHFSEFEAFSKAIAEDGFFESGRPLRKAMTTAAKLGLVSAEESAALQTLYERVQAARASLQVSCVIHHHDNLCFGTSHSAHSRSSFIIFHRP